MKINREIAPHLKHLAQQFPAVAVMGPRQSGKTTLVKETFPDYAYVTLEDIDKRLMATEDPRGFLNAYSDYKGVIFDEIQEVPELFSYMQGIIDQAYRPGYFILTGSQNFLLHEKITQSLAGRIALLTLLPLSTSEIKDAGLLPDEIEALLIKGAYPQLYAQNIDGALWCSNYISTYIEKDVRQLLKITDVLRFQRFLQLCAARVGNQINYSELARDADMSPHTVKEWLSVLETSYIIKLITPYYKNFSKRITKQPKLYFYDSALVCSLLNIRTKAEMFVHPLKGALVESFVISEIIKYNYNNNKRPDIYFWRDVQGHEIDCIIEKSYNITIPIEVKASKTMSQDFFKGLKKWQEITGQETVEGYVVYAGENTMEWKHGYLWAWNNIKTMLERIYK